MKTVVSFLLAFTLRVALWFRYRVKITGLKTLNSSTLKKPGGILFLPNHPTVFVDPVLIYLAAWSKYPIRPMVVEYMFNLPVVHWIMKMINALPVPNFSNSSNSIKKRRSEQVTEAVIEGLEKKKENFLIYPAGKLKDSGLEVLGGASAVHNILQQAPDTNVVLVRIKGLWGSMFSRAFTGVSPPMFPKLWEGVKIVFKNILLFTPRRKVVIEFVPAPADFPYTASKLELNRYLENWYNQPDGLTQQKGDLPGDSFILVSHSMWGEQYPVMTKATNEKESEVVFGNIPGNVKDKVMNKLVEVTEFNPSKITPDMTLASDLGMDSLDAAEIVAFLQDEFDISGVGPGQLDTVGHLMGVAAGQIVVDQQAEEKDHANLVEWNKARTGTPAIAAGKTIPEVFLNICAQKGKQAACIDVVSGILTYKDMKLRAILMAEYIRHLPGKYIGILLPASVGATVLILATQLAGKIPLMVNWTVGFKHLESVVKLSQVEVILSSWGFLDKLENVNLDPIEKKLLLLEDVRRKITLTDKLKAFMRSKMSTKFLLKTFKIDKTSPKSSAVLLFTSGTESLPKGVPLSHENILSDLISSLETVKVRSEDVLYGILPSFHAFGFTVSALLGTLSGVRVAFSPDPTDGKTLAKNLQRWGVTVTCGAPAFIKGILKAATSGQLSSMRLCVTGAEKAPPELFLMFEKLGLKNCLREGYGITECSPVLTMNRDDIEPVGVGQPISCVEILMVHPETFEPVAQNIQGAILVRGPNIFSGYLNPGLSSPFIKVQGKEWYKTGDLGYVDALNRLTITGRQKRFIKIGAEMVSLASIEDSLLKIAIAKGWPTSEDGPTLAICAKEIIGEKPKISLFSRFDIPVDEVNKLLKESGFSNLVKISSVIHLPEIPLTGSGKINYRALEAQYMDS